MFNGSGWAFRGIAMEGSSESTPLSKLILKSSFSKEIILTCDRSGSATINLLFLFI